jgi:hypothetical protein
MDLRTPILAAALLFLFGCGPSLPDIDPAVDRDAEATARMKESAALEDLVGRYAKGAVPIYRGTARASDDASARGGEDGKLSGDVVGAITPSQSDRAGWELAVYAPMQTRLTVTQTVGAPGRSDFALGTSGSCVGCFVDLASPPTRIHAASLTARGAPLADPTLLATVAVAELTLTRVTQLTFQDITAAHDAVEGPIGEATFTQRGGEMVREVSDDIYVPIAGTKAFNSCTRTLSYEAEWYVNLANVADYGVRSFAITKRKTCCRNEDGDDTGQFSPPTCESDE